MYEEEIKRFATWVNGKIDILGERVPESIEQVTLEVVFRLIVKVLPEMAYGVPVRAVAVSLAMQLVDSPESVGPRTAQAMAALVAGDGGEASP